MDWLKRWFTRKDQDKTETTSASKRAKITSSLLMFSALYEAKKPLKYTIVYILALVNAFFLLVFIQQTGL
ncbi:hypothetical protein MPTA7396_7090 [Mycoplasmoides pneumoniae]